MRPEHHQGTPRSLFVFKPPCKTLSLQIVSDFRLIGAKKCLPYHRTSTMVSCLGRRYRWTSV